MAVRPVFVPAPDGKAFVRTEMVQFTWHAGLSASQKQKSIASLHDEAKALLGISAILEVSSKSMSQLGVELSAFNLMLSHPATQADVSVECTFQASKVFRDGGPYPDILTMTSRDAKRDARLKESGPLKAFRFAGQDWPLEPQTAFYDWLYLNALRHRPKLAAQAMTYQAFTDIEFNPQQSINCQAYSVALYAALSHRGLLNDALSSRDAFLACLKSAPVNNARQNDLQQGSLF
jgi:hypothetical protein